MSSARQASRLWCGPRVDEIEGVAIEDRARDLDGADRLGGAVQPAKRLEVGVVQRLDAERDAIDAGGAIATEARGLDARRVGLERDFGRRARSVQCLATASRMAPTVCGFISEGVEAAAAKKIDCTVRARRQRGAMREFGRQSARDVACHRRSAWRARGC